MSTIRIGSDERDLRDADSSWITSEIIGRRKDGQPVCVVVNINEPGASLPLVTEDCRVGRGEGRGGARPPNPLEREIIALWDRRGLGSGDISPGELVSFVRQVLRLF